MRRVIGVLVVIAVLILAQAAWILWPGFGSREVEQPSVVIRGTPARVFASIATADSLSTWMFSTVIVRGRKARLVEGDTILSNPAVEGEKATHGFDWIVTDVKPDTVLGLVMRDTSGRDLFRRRDSVFARGDSTVVASSVSLVSWSPDAGAVGTASLRASEGMVRRVVRSQLERLKERIEGR